MSSQLRPNRKYWSYDIVGKSSSLVEDTTGAMFENFEGQGAAALWRFPATDKAKLASEKSNVVEAQQRRPGSFHTFPRSGEMCNRAS